jgi:FixJ family two-component response regulator
MQNKVKALGAKEFIRKPVKTEVLTDHLQQHGLL